MNDKNPKTEGLPDGVVPDKSAGRRKRTAPTIDLEAKEIPPADPAVTEPVAETFAAAQDSDAVSEAAAIKEDVMHDEPAQTPPSDDSAPTPQRPNSLKPILVGGIAGAAAAAIVVGIAVASGVFSRNDATGSDPRVAALEAQVKDLQSRPAPAARDTAANDTLTPRMAKIEGQVAKLSSAPSNDNALTSLGVALTALNRRYDELAATTRDVQARATAAEQSAADLRRSLQDVSRTAQDGPSSADMTSLQQRLAALEEQSKTARADLTKATESDKAARLALSATAVRDAALRGVPFAEELAQAKSLGASEAALAPLWPFAASGVPSVKVLAKELSDLMPQIRKAVTPAPVAANGFLERLQANAETLVRVRPAGAPAGEDASAALARLEADIAKEDIAAALTDIGTLPQAGRQLASDWVTRAMARQKALTAARDFAADSARSLGSR